MSRSGEIHKMIKIFNLGLVIVKSPITVNRSFWCTNKWLFTSGDKDHALVNKTIAINFGVLLLRDILDIFSQGRGQRSKRFTVVVWTFNLEK